MPGPTKPPPPTLQRFELPPSAILTLTPEPTDPVFGTCGTTASVFPAGVLAPLRVALGLRSNLEGTYVLDWSTDGSPATEVAIYLQLLGQPEVPLTSQTGAQGEIHWDFPEGDFYVRFRVVATDGERMGEARAIADHDVEVVSPLLANLILAAVDPEQRTATLTWTIEGLEGPATVVLTAEPGGVLIFTGAAEATGTAPEWNGASVEGDTIRFDLAVTDGVRSTLTSTTWSISTTTQDVSTLELVVLRPLPGDTVRMGETIQVAWMALGADGDTTLRADLPGVVLPVTHTGLPEAGRLSHSASWIVPALDHEQTVDLEFFADDADNSTSTVVTVQVLSAALPPLDLTLQVRVINAETEPEYELFWASNGSDLTVVTLYASVDGGAENPLGLPVVGEEGAMVWEHTPAFSSVQFRAEAVDGERTAGAVTSLHAVGSDADPLQASLIMVPQSDGTYDIDWEVTGAEDPVCDLILDAGTGVPDVLAPARSGATGSYNWAPHGVESAIFHLTVLDGDRTTSATTSIVLRELDTLSITLSHTMDSSGHSPVFKIRWRISGLSASASLQIGYDRVITDTDLHESSNLSPTQIPLSDELVEGETNWTSNTGLAHTGSFTATLTEDGTGRIAEDQTSFAYSVEKLRPTVLLPHDTNVALGDLVRIEWMAVNARGLTHMWYESPAPAGLHEPDDPLNDDYFANFEPVEFYEDTRRAWFNWRVEGDIESRQTFALAARDRMHTTSTTLTLRIGPPRALIVSVTATPNADTYDIAWTSDAEAESCTVNIEIEVPGNPPEVLTGVDQSPSGTHPWSPPTGPYNATIVVTVRSYGRQGVGWTTASREQLDPPREPMSILLVHPRPPDQVVRRDNYTVEWMLMGAVGVTEITISHEEDGISTETIIEDSPDNSRIYSKILNITHGGTLSISATDSIGQTSSISTEIDAVEPPPEPLVPPLVHVRSLGRQSPDGPENVMVSWEVDQPDSTSIEVNVLSFSGTTLASSGALGGRDSYTYELDSYQVIFRVTSNREGQSSESRVMFSQSPALALPIKFIQQSGDILSFRVEPDVGTAELSALTMSTERPPAEAVTTGFANGSIWTPEIGTSVKTRFSAAYKQLESDNSHIHGYSESEFETTRLAPGGLPVWVEITSPPGETMTRTSTPAIEGILHGPPNATYSVRFSAAILSGSNIASPQHFGPASITIAENGTKSISSGTIVYSQSDPQVLMIEVFKLNTFGAGTISVARAVRYYDRA